MQQLRYIKRELNLEWDGKQSIITAFKAIGRVSAWARAAWAQCLRHGGSANMR